MKKPNGDYRMGRKITGTQKSSNSPPSVGNYLTIMFKRMLTVLVGFSRQSTIHSLSHLAQARNIKQRLFWLLIALLASIGFLFNLINIIEKYLEKPVLTNIYHDKNEFIFPDLSLCLINPIYFPPESTIQFKELQHQIQLYQKFKKLSHLTQRRSQLTSHFNFKNYSLDVDLSDFLFIQPNIEYSHPHWNSIFYCKYMQKSCNYQHFKIRHIWPYGNCFTFSSSLANMSRSIASMNKNAWRPDLKLIIHKGLPPPNSFNIDPFNSLNTPSGVLVMIHEANTFPYPDEGIIVDSYTQIDLKITTKVHLNVNNKCDVTRRQYEYYDTHSEEVTKVEGRQPDCLFEVIQSAVAKRCNCLLQNMPVLNKFRHLPFCLALEINETLYNYQYHQQIDNFKNKTDLSECIKQGIERIDQYKMNKVCHRDLCKHPSFATVVSHSKYPAVKERQNQLIWLKELERLETLQMKYYNTSDLYLKCLKPDLRLKYNLTSIKHALWMIERKYNESSEKINFLNENYVDKNFMQVRMVPSSLFMDHIQESLEYTLSRLLGDIGGCIGLWIGASLITIFEFVDLVFRFGDLMSSYRHHNGHVKRLSGNPDNIRHRSRRKSDKSSDKMIMNSSPNRRESKGVMNKLRYLTEDETGDFEDELGSTLMQPLSIIQNSHSYFFKQFRIEDL